MTDIENIKKMNKMIPELKKHGFADSSDEAAEQSAQIYQNRFIEETKDEIAKKHEPQSAKDVVSFDHLERLKGIVNGRLNDMEAKLSTVTAKMNEMVKMINKLETLQGSTAVKDEPSQRQTVIKDEKPSPRSGDYTSSDVEIEKIFYFGNK